MPFSGARKKWKFTYAIREEFDIGSHSFYKTGDQPITIESGQF